MKHAQRTQTRSDSQSISTDSSINRVESMSLQKRFGKTTGEVIQGSIYSWNYGALKMTS